MLRGKRVAPRNIDIARCTDFMVVDLINVGATKCGAGTIGSQCSVTQIIEPMIYNNKGSLTYHWSFSGGTTNDGGNYTDPTYTLVSTGTDTPATIDVTLLVTDSDGTTSTITRQFKITIGTP